MGVLQQGEAVGALGGTFTGIMIAMAASLPLWMIGWDQFLREARHAACVQVVTLLHEAMAGACPTLTYTSCLLTCSLCLYCTDC